MARIPAAIAAVLLLIAPLQAKDKPGRGKGRGHEGAAVARRVPRPAVRMFRDGDAGIIREYYRGGLPPGLAKRGDLPPGLEKQLRRNGTLPPGVRKKFVPFPAALEAQLPPCPAYVRRGFVGGIAVMWNSRTGTILDASMMFAQ
jgi:hypothetical protein